MIMQIKLCSYCQHKINANDIFCASCGKKAQKISIKKYVLWSICVLIFFILGGYIFYLKSAEDNTFTDRYRMGLSGQVKTLIVSSYTNDTISKQVCHFNKYGNITTREWSDDNKLIRSIENNYDKQNRIIATVETDLGYSRYKMQCSTTYTYFSTGGNFETIGKDLYSDDIALKEHGIVDKHGSKTEVNTIRFINGRQAAKIDKKTEYNQYGLPIITTIKVPLNLLGNPDFNNYKEYKNIYKYNERGKIIFSETANLSTSEGLVTTTEDYTYIDNNLTNVTRKSSAWGQTITDYANYILDKKGNWVSRTVISSYYGNQKSETRESREIVYY